MSSTARMLFTISAPRSITETSMFSEKERMSMLLEPRTATSSSMVKCLAWSTNGAL